MRSHLGLPRKRVSVLQVLFFSLSHVRMALIFIFLAPSWSFFSTHSPFSDQESLFRKFLLVKYNIMRLVNHMQFFCYFYQQIHEFEFFLRSRIFLDAFFGFSVCSRGSLNFFRFLGFFYIFLRPARTWNMPKTWIFFLMWSKNGIFRVKALDELIIFAIDHNFPKCLFRAVEVVKVGWNMQKMTFFNFNWVWDMGCAKWPLGSGEYFYYWGRPSPTLIHRDMGPYVGQNDQKSTKFFVFGYETWCVQLNGLMVGIILCIRID